MKRHRSVIRHRPIAAAVLCVAALLSRCARADEYDPPATYYNTATSTGATLKSQLNNIIGGHTTRSYNQLRTDLQATDAVPVDPTKIYVVYNNRIPITKPTGDSIPGWDNGNTWNREHSWPQARGVDGTGAPDGSDMHHVLPSKNSDNGTRDNYNFGGAFGQQPRGRVNDGGTKYYPGDLDAGFIARAQFYMAVRYDGTDSGTTNLELVTGNPDPGGTTMGDLNRLIEWHFAAPPDAFERRRNQIIYDEYQHNRNPFVDRPEFVWSIFADQANDSRITISGGTTDANGGSVRNIDYGRVFKDGSSPPTTTAITLNKVGFDGTYYEVTTSGLATSTVMGRYNAFRTNTTDSRNLTVGLNADTSSIGLKTGSVTINNLDITTGGGADRGANDGDDTINMSLTVLDHATPSFAADSIMTSLVHDFGTRSTADMPSSFGFDVYNFATTPVFTADMDFDALLASGNTSAITTDAASLAESLTLAAGGSQQFSAYLNTATVGVFAATYTFRFSDEDLPGAENNKDIALTLTGTVILAGDFNRDNIVDASDYVVWKKTNGQSAVPYAGADADGSGGIDDTDLALWKANFGQTAQNHGSGGSYNVPEPAVLTIALTLTLACMLVRRLRT